jgi:hypothetical protein
LNLIAAEDSCAVSHVNAQTKVANIIFVNACFVVTEKSPELEKRPGERGCFFQSL